MLGYMEYLQDCFYTSTGWNTDNNYDNILATSRNLLAFPIPRNFRFELSSRSSEFTNSSVSLTNTGILGGSLSYLSTTTPLANAMASRSVPLQSMVSGYRILETFGPRLPTQFVGATLLYGRIYFPSQFLEGMVIKRVSPNTQFILKCISTPKVTGGVKGGGAMTFYWQTNKAKSSREFIFSTSEALLGFRCLYNIGKGFRDGPSRRGKIFGSDGSSLSIGTELWYGALSMSPGLSTALRYSTYSSSTGAPMTMTLSCNPLLGSFSSTYSVRTGIGSTFCSKYDLNVYSSESDLSFGYEFWRSIATRPPKEQPKLDAPAFNKLNEEEQMRVVGEFIGAQQDKFGNPGAAWGSRGTAPFHTARKFVSNLRETDFSSVLKASTSIQTGKLSVSFSGKIKDFLVTTGASVNLYDTSSTVKAYGVQIQYSS
ncbi:unnamed protein product [Kuraishia capsulata CBS 1993]|uniref:Mitochondrial distribution and morphology protein 10 n=1 Tax=Kuraishia capsulata CBS 1993 TaxID=1382522 RepID=W6MT99_9ASCO|nr:uncharacterized protein KUCA_T00005621001 [Kuraishia capsulata CBS 1993]CDK29628.1 unnamed protein product [Kuraishia capsulata CBS 1993]